VTTIIIQPAQAAAYTAGKAQHDLEAFQKTQGALGSSGADHPDAPVFIVLGIVNGLITYYLHTETLLFGWESWKSMGVWLGSVVVVYWVLRLLPDMVRGLLMGTVLGGGVGWVVWTQADLWWGSGSGIVAGIFMFLVFYAMGPDKEDG